MPNSIHALYSERMQNRQSEARRLGQLDRALSNWRLVVLALALVTLGAAIFSNTVYIFVVPVPVLIFICLAIRHDRVITALQDAKRSADFYLAGTRRLENSWQGHGDRGSEFHDSEHLYSEDLDLFGRASVFEYLCIARTGAGRRTLAHWLSAPAERDVILKRQAAVAELAEKLDLRETLTVLGDDMPPAARIDAIRYWATAAPIDFPGWARSAGILFAIANCVTAILWATGSGPVALLISGASSGLFVATFRGGPGKSIKGAKEPARDLVRLVMLLPCIEKDSFASPLMIELKDRMSGAVSGIEQLQKWLYLTDSLSNQIIMPLALLLLLPLQIAIGFEAWRRQCGQQVAEWIDAIGEIEALSSLSSMRFEHPEDVFPQIVDGSPKLHVREMAHPLLPEASAIRNNLTLGDPESLLIVSGSNMSGKSTFLRATGANVALAMAGGCVRAREFKLTPLLIGASIRTQDSLDAGISRFYAEILRLRQVVELSREREGVLFLLDEILQGTNSHDRRIGAEAVLRALVDAGAVGMATTHDLALAEIASKPGSHSANVHFEDQLVDGKMGFDYRLRAGVVQHSNALELMRSIGLEV